ncbi:MAG TPA: sigma-70 family RNA polymerase sigma factor [Iamia sp.]|nr:sigma-70 family RNA polymerase sigma factor [Iamia sp.]
MTLIDQPHSLDHPVRSRPGDDVQLRRRCDEARRALRTELDELAARLDVCRAWRTVPMGADATDPRRTPGVDIDLWVLHVRFERTGSRDHLAALVQEYTPYALAIAGRLVRHGEPREDVDQVALESLVTALRRFDTSRRTPFAAFATPTISGAIKRHYRDRGWALRTSRQVHDLAGPVRAAHDRLALGLGRRATTTEVAAELGVEAQLVTTVEEGMAARTLTSLDRPVVEGGMTLVDTLGQVDRDLDLTDTRLALAEALEVLDERDREILSLYFVQELSQRAIGARYGVSQMQVSRWLASIIGRLRSRMDV